MAAKCTDYPQAMNLLSILILWFVHKGEKNRRALSFLL